VSLSLDKKVGVYQHKFNLSCHSWSLHNHFWTGQGCCPASLHEWGLAMSCLSACGHQTVHCSLLWTNRT